MTTVIFSCVDEWLDPFSTGNPFLGTLLGLVYGGVRGKGLSAQQQYRQG